MMEESTKSKSKEGKQERHKNLKYTLYLSIFIGYAVFYYNRKSYSSLIPALLQSQYLGESELGFISSCFAFSYGLSKFGSGILSDKLQPRELFVFGLIATGICNIFFTFIDGVMFLSCVWFVNGLVQGLAWPQCAKLLRVWFEPHEIGTYWSLLTVGCNTMAGFCPLIAIHVTSHYSWQYAMLLPGLLAFASSPVLYMTIYNSPKEAGLAVDNKMDNATGKQKPAKYAWSKVFLQILRSPFLWVLLHGDFLTAILKNAIGDWIQLYLIQDKKQSQSTAGLAVTFFEIGGVLGSFLAGVITDNWMQKQDPAKCSSARMPAFIWLYTLLLVCVHLLRKTIGPSSSTLFIGILLFGCGMALSGSTSLYGLVAMENGPLGFSGTTHAIVALGSSFGGVMAGYPLATFAKLYGWHRTFLLLQVMATINLVVHFFTRDLKKNMVDVKNMD